MIKTSVQQCREAYAALFRINEEVRLSQKPAWRVSRLLSQLKPVVREFEETQLKLYKDAGGMQSGNGVMVPAPEREDDESSQDWAARQKAHRDKMAALSDELRALNQEEVEINYDAIPLKLFEDDEKAPAERRQFSANDFLNCGPFLVEEELKKE